MNDLIIYHNPRCSKSRQTLQIIKDHGIKPTIVEYLKTPLDKLDLKNISRLLNKRPKDFVRKNEADFKENNIKDLLSNNTSSNLFIKKLLDISIKKPFPTALRDTKIIYSLCPLLVRHIKK